MTRKLRARICLTIVIAAAATVAALASQNDNWTPVKASHLVPLNSTSVK